MTTKKTYCVMILLLGMIIVFAVPGCNESITGSPMVYSIDREGYIKNRDEYLEGQYITKADTITISFNTLFMKLIKEGKITPGSHLLVYSEVYDSPEDANPYVSVIFNQKHQPQNSILGVVDRVIYGPIQYKGYPIRVKLYVVELDKKDNELGQKILSTVGEVVSAAQPQLAPTLGVGITIGQILGAFNEDDYELRVDITFHPHSAVTNKNGNMINIPLRCGHYLIAKTESQSRLEADSISKISEYLPADSFESEKYVEAKLQYLGGYLWLDTYTEANNPESLDETIIYKEKTYAVLAIRSGGEQANEQKMRAVAQDEAKTIQALLQEDNHQNILDGFSSIGQQISAKLTIKHIVNAANKRVIQQSDFRQNPEFVRIYIRQLIGEDEKAGYQTKFGGEEYITRLNASLIGVIESTCINFPLNADLDGDNYPEIKKVKERAEQTGAITYVKNSGQMFRWNQE